LYHHLNFGEIILPYLAEIAEKYSGFKLHQQQSREFSLFLGTFSALKEEDYQ
jgi:hypothetical protein